MGSKYLQELIALEAFKRICADQGFVNLGLAIDELLARVTADYRKFVDTETKAKDHVSMS